MSNYAQMTPTPNDKIYQAGEDFFSINDILSMAAHPDYRDADGFARISDFHFKVGMPIRLRLDNQLVDLSGGVPLSKEGVERMIFPLLHPLVLKRFLDSEDADVDGGYEMQGSQNNYRINLFRDRDGTAAVIRMLNERPPQIESVGFPNPDVWQEILELKQGLVIVTGVAGAGKSTTIASLLRRINETRPVHIITLEDPVEYIFRSEVALVSQREVNVSVHSFARGLRSAMRENPDIIFVGEIRDQETAALALTAAETGHLVFTTLHTRDATGALTRLVDMMPAERMSEISLQLSFSLNYVIAQKLIPLKDEKGRLPAFEILRNNSAVENLIRTNNLSQLSTIMGTRKREGMRLLEHSLLEMVQRGDIDAQTALAYANDTDAMQRLLDDSPLN